MRKHTVSLILVALAAMPLGGCKALFGNSDHLSARKALTKPFTAEEYAQSQLATGRAALGNGNWAEAIIAFREAQRDPQLAAQAHNGMGVAYAELGRPDLAERYFTLAIAEAPGDRRFSANLARLYALTATPEPVLAAAPEAIPAVTPQRSALTTTNPAIRVERPGGRLVRTAHGELRLQSAPDSRDEARMASAAPPARTARSGVTFTHRSARPQ